MLWFDMDGVICKYERDAYLPKNPNMTPAFITKDEHYFATCKPDVKALNVMTRLVFGGVPVGVCSSVWQDDKRIRDEQITDKLKWIERNLKDLFAAGFDIPVVFSGYSKSAAIKAAGLWESTAENNILVDDYRKNLEQWTKEGAVAVKYLNHINSPWNGLQVSCDSSAEEIANCLFDLASSSMAVRTTAV